jgi:hypothetical protein
MVYFMQEAKRADDFPRKEASRKERERARERERESNRERERDIL